jgi:ABC-type branched-subunit amino acid transport system ATPase component/branched-subunit amino acid ABC-type transport system permease component
MNAYLPFIVTGLATGAIYGLVGAGLVLTYKTSGIFNFAYGAIAAVSAYAFYWLNVVDKLNWGIAAFVSVVVLGPVAGLLFEFMGRKLAERDITFKVVSTIGVILIVEGLTTIKFGPDSLTQPQFLPKGNDTFHLGGVTITYAQVIVTAIAAIAVLGLYFLFRWTRLGVSMRAVVDDPSLVSLHGTNPQQVRRTAWIIGTTFAALSGILLSPFLGVNAIVLIFLVVQAFGAVSLGGFSSIPLTFLGGLVIGILASVLENMTTTVSWLSSFSGLPASVPFVVLFVVLLVTPRRKFTIFTGYVKRPAPSWHGPTRLRVAVGIVVIGALALLPVVDPSKLDFFIPGLAVAILLLSLGLLVRTSGQLSLAATTFAAVGAVAYSQFKVGLDIPWILALLLGALVVVPIGLLIAIPAIRLPGLFLALATFGFALLMQQLYFPLSIGFTTATAGRPMPRPTGFASDFRYYYVVLAFLVLSALGMIAIHRSRLGRMLRGLSDSPLAVGVMGLSTNTTKAIVFCISAFFAGVSGILYGMGVHAASSSDAYFSPFNSLVYLALLAISPFTSPWYALFGVLSFVVTAFASGSNTTQWLNVIFGVFAILVAIQGGTPPMPAWFKAFLAKFGITERRTRYEVERPVEDSPESFVAHVPSVTSSGLKVDDLSVRFGGLLAVNGVTLTAPLGRITGLIGPNGAGKTTTFNACSGLNQPSDGRVLLNEKNVSHLGASQRGRLGLGRTFQITELCDSLTVAENVGLGREASLAGRGLVSTLWASSSAARQVQAATKEALRLCEIEHLADTQAGNLSTGQRRLTELARCLAGPFNMLLLDEPSSGLDREETVRFGDLLVRVLEERGCGMLLVEHDMSLVMRICAYIYVLDFGKLLFEGRPEEVAGSPLVRAAYLGSDEAGLDEVGLKEEGLNAALTATNGDGQHA